MQVRLIHHLTANAITGFHFLWAILIFGGGVFVLFAHWYAPYQIAVMTVTIIANLPLRGTCPSTLLEEKLRQKVDASYSNHNSFTATYLNKICGTNFSVRNVNIFITIFYIAAYGTALWLVLR